MRARCFAKVKLLKPGSPVYISTMEDNYSNSGIRKSSGGDEIFMHYYLEEDLTRILTSNQFVIVSVMRKSYPGPDDTIITDVLVLATRA